MLMFGEIWPPGRSPRGASQTATCTLKLEIGAPCSEKPRTEKQPKILGWHLCRTKLPRKAFNSKRQVKRKIWKTPRNVPELGAKKEPQSQKIARTAPKTFLNNSRGFPVPYPLKQGFWGKSHQKVHPKVRQNLCRKSFFGVPFLSLTEQVEALFSCLKVFHRHIFKVLHPKFQTRFQTLFYTENL